NAARSAASTCHSGNSWLPNRTVVAGARAAKSLPGSGPGRPASRAPRPTPSSSEISSISPGPPHGFGPVRATAQPRGPVRSAPARATQGTGQPVGSGQGSQPGTAAPRSRPSRPSADVLYAIRSGCTSPCTSHCHELHQALGSRTGPPQRGQVGAVLILTDRCAPAAIRQVPGQIVFQPILNA